MTLNLVAPEKMTADEVAQMKKVFTDSKNTINRAIEDLKSMAFTFEQLTNLEKFDEAEVIMAKFASMSVAVNAWREVIPHLDEFSTPFEAIAAGCMILEKKYMMAGEAKEKSLET